MPVAQIDASLFDQLINAFAAYPKDQVTIARVERSGRSIMKSDPVMGYVVLGACAAARGDAAAAKRNHEASLRLAPLSEGVWSNYMVSLAILNDINGARDKAFELGSRFLHNPAALNSGMNALTELGLLRSAAQFLKEFPSVREYQPLDYTWVDCIDDVLDRHHVTEDEFAGAVVSARGFLGDKGVVRSEYSCRYLADDMGGPGEIAYGFHIRSSVEHVRKLERELFAFLGRASLVAEERGAVTFYVGFTEEREGSAKDVAAAC